jgi:ectoine hydroxylase-related dioxygenase (phytanoyl-CoA dioxygenase family)
VLHVKDAFTANDVRQWRDECERLGRLHELFDPCNLRTHVMGSEVRSRDRIDPVVDVSPVFASLVADSRLVHPVTEVLRDEPSLFKDKLILKPPGARGYDCHQDFAYWQTFGVPPDAMVTVVVAIDDASHKNGGLEVFRGQHGAPLYPRGSTDDVDEADLDPTTGLVPELRSGDLLLLHSLMPHRSSTNNSPNSRRQLFVTYSVRSYGDLYRSYYERQRSKLIEALPPDQRARSYFR